MTILLAGDDSIATSTWWVKMNFVALLFSFAFQDGLKFVHPVDTTFAGETTFVLETNAPADDILGLEMWINDLSAHYFEEPPFEVTLDLSDYPEGPIVIRAELSLFEDRKHTAELKGENFTSYLEEDVLLVRVPVMVQTEAGLAQTNVDERRFELREEGQPQKLAHIYDEQHPLNLVVLLDMSGSMQRRVVILRQGVLRLLDLLRPGDSIQLIGFNHQVFEICPPETDMGVVRKKLYLIEADGYTNLYGAVWSGIKSAAKSKSRRALILFTDGEHEMEGQEDPYEKTLEDCVDLAREKGVPVYAMGMGAGISPEVLETLSNQTGGKPFLMRRPKAIRDAFQTIGEELRHQYLLCYYSPSKKSGWHHIAVAVEGVPEDRLQYPKKLYFR